MNRSCKPGRKLSTAWKTPILLAILGVASMACSKGDGPDLPNSPPRPKMQAQAGPIVTAQFHLPERPRPRRPLRT